jgi:predicted Zn-dependent protease
VLAREGRAADARDQYEELLDRVPDDRAGRIGHAELALAGGDRAGCARDARLVLAHDPDDSEARRLAAACAAP